MTDKYILDLITAGLEGDSSKVEIAALTLSRDLRKQHPELSTKIRTILSEYSFFGNKVVRGGKMGPPPVDPDSQLQMASIIQPDPLLFVRPILEKSINNAVDNFIEERKNAEILLQNGVRPPSSLLLTGLPGTGKTMLAKYLASALNKDLITLDISASISSLLGKTGSNIKKVLNYAKNTSSVLLLDEFDAIAKKRDDISDLGEIKRVVNVLLMEMEEWPISSLLIATSNHPELLDKAVWRRFDHVFNIDLPNLDQRSNIISNQFADLSNTLDKAILNKIAVLLEGNNASDICRFANNVKRRMLVKNDPFIRSIVNEIGTFSLNKKSKGLLCVLAKETLGEEISVRDLAAITGLSSSGVQHHLSKYKN